MRRFEFLDTTGRHAIELVWIVGAQVPEGGVPSKTPTLEELEADLGQERPGNFNVEAMRRKIEAMNR